MPGMRLVPAPPPPVEYSECGRDGEPRVIHVDTEGEELQVRVLAPTLEAFLLGLVDCGPFHERMDSALDRGD